MKCRFCASEVPAGTTTCPSCSAPIPGSSSGRSGRSESEMVSRTHLLSGREMPARIRPRRADAELRRRRWPPPELPERPYPVLLPYSHPALFAGRDRELAQLRRLLRLPVPILGLSAPSGAGKSSLLLGGLVPALREEGTPVALTRHPHEPGVAGCLLGDLVENAPAEVDFHAFVDRLLEVERFAGESPILVLDQFEDVLRRPDAGRARAVLGVLLAATVRRRPAAGGGLDDGRGPRPGAGDGGGVELGPAAGGAPRGARADRHGRARDRAGGPRSAGGQTGRRSRPAARAFAAAGKPDGCARTRDGRRERGEPQHRGAASGGVLPEGFEELRAVPAERLRIRRPTVDEELLDVASQELLEPLRLRPARVALLRIHGASSLAGGAFKVRGAIFCQENAAVCVRGTTNTSYQADDG